MKKYLLMTVVLITAALSLTSCGDDEPKEKVTATATYNMTFSQDLLNACNVFITYKAENGRNVMEAVTSTWWTKTVTSNDFPAEFGVMYKFSTKSNAELTQEQYDLTCDLNFNVKTSKGASYSNNVTIINAPDVKKDKVVSTLDKLSGKSTGYRVSKDGIVSQANNLNYE
ncbi:MAG: hypothetical protein IJG42_01085 [Muribaculaceae bacterium]|nr:hypothetical protein [Muribaculaceae bacterium]